MRARATLKALKALKALQGFKGLWGGKTPCESSSAAKAQPDPETAARRKNRGGGTRPNGVSRRPEPAQNGASGQG